MYTETTVTPNVAVIDPDTVARSKSLHFMLTMLVEVPALDIILNSGQGEGCESWRRPENLEETPPVALIAVASVSDGYLFSIMLDSDFGDEVTPSALWCGH